MAGWDEFAGLNHGYLIELYERYREDPSAVDDDARAFFSHWPAGRSKDPSAPVAGTSSTPPFLGVVTLADSIRRYGHLAALIDPLGRPRQGDPALDPGTHGVTDSDLRALPASLVGGPLANQVATAFEAIAGLRRVYCSTIGHDSAHVFAPEERHWLTESAEGGRFRAPADPIDPLALLKRLTAIESFEHFLHRTFPAKMRFSIEGLDMLIPVLDEVLAEAAEAGTGRMLIGMGHRGRLNALTHVLSKPYAQVLAEFRDPLGTRSFGNNTAWTGDVRYHLGASRALRGGRQVDLAITMPPNPSHLEAIDPIVEGMARAAGTRTDQPGAPAFDPRRTIPILIHGDASFQGQGVVAEVLNLARLRGYSTGGTVHIITNNQLGFTTDPDDLYSTLYACGLARGFKVPIVHVNADDPEACIEAARLAFAYRDRFEKDFVIDLVGYRRYGHNEADEPSFTQPLMYEQIERHPSVRAIWASTLTERGVIEPSEADELYQDALRHLQTEMKALEPEKDLVEPVPPVPPAGAAAKVVTGIPLDVLRDLNTSLLTLPPDFVPHRKLSKARERRRQVLDDLNATTVDWATAEELALASILSEGTPIRLTGQDVARGTFSQRHAVFHNTAHGGTFTPLAALPQARASFEIHNSPLTENAALGFEYGYNAQSPDRLVIWEAQYGDFLNGAAVVIDEFIASARVKWGQTPSLVLLLPHGDEGQGPDHASARPERLLQLTADLNMRVATCTTAAQYFHLLRRQALLLIIDPLPLIVLTPKSLLRHPLVSSAPRALSDDRWQPVIDDARASARAAEVRRLVLCSGKIYIDLVTSQQWEVAEDVAACRIEQLYPVPMSHLRKLVDRYPGIEELVWAQEEPQNMGAWRFLQPYLHELGGARQIPVRYIGRPRSSSPAEGSAARYAVTQAAIIRAVLTRDVRAERAETRRR